MEWRDRTGVPPAASVQRPALHARAKRTDAVSLHVARRRHVHYGRGEVVVGDAQALHVRDQGPGVERLRAWIYRRRSERERTYTRHRDTEARPQMMIRVRNPASSNLQAMNDVEIRKRTPDGSVGRVTHSNVYGPGLDRWSTRRLTRPTSCLTLGWFQRLSFPATTTTPSSDIDDFTGQVRAWWHDGHGGQHNSGKTNGCWDA